MTFLNMYKRVSLPSVAECQSSCTFLAMDLVIGNEFGLLSSPQPPNQPSFKSISFSASTPSNLFPKTTNTQPTLWWQQSTRLALSSKPIFFFLSNTAQPASTDGWISYARKKLFLGLNGCTITTYSLIGNHA